jgi:hypothetical protein
VAADWVVKPAIKTEGKYLSNINNSPKIRTSDYILSARPGVSLAYNSETAKLEGQLALLGLHYLQHDSFDRINQYYNLNGSYKPTARLDLQLATSFISDSTATEELQASGTLMNRRMRTSFNAIPGFSYALSERWSTLLQYSFNMVDYQSSFYNSYEGHIITHGFDYILSEKTILLSRLTGSYYKYKNNNSFTALGPQIGFTYKYLEKWNMTFLGGLNFNRIKSNTAILAVNNFTGFLEVRTRPQISRSTSPFFSLGTNYNWETGFLSVNYTRSQSANAYGNQSQYNNFNINIHQNVTNRWYFNVNPYLYTSSIKYTGSNYNSYYYGIRPSLFYRLTEKASIGTSYAFTYRTVTGTTNYHFPINEVVLTLNYSEPTHY